VANTIHFNALGSTFQHELCSGFALQAMDQKDEGDMRSRSQISSSC
jgi:hypothetical protein